MDTAVGFSDFLKNLTFSKVVANRTLLVFGIEFDLVKLFNFNEDLTSSPDFFLSKGIFGVKSCNSLIEPKEFETSLDPTVKVLYLFKGECGIIK